MIIYVNPVLSVAGNGYESQTSKVYNLNLILDMVMKPVLCGRNSYIRSAEHPLYADDDVL